MKSFLVTRKKSAFIGFSVIILLVLIAGVFFTYQTYQNKSEQKKINSLCNTDEIGTGVKEYSATLTPTNVSTLKPFADKAIALDGHEKSANCLYIVTAYQAYSGNVEEALSRYAKLGELYAAGDKIDASYGEDAKKNLDDFMSGLDEVKASYEANTFRGVIPKE
jgi:predicted negative regulator of RcsB-dependent stress response